MAVGSASWSFTEEDFGAITEALQRFLQSTFDAGAALLDWPKGLVIDGPPRFGRPPA